MSYDELEGGGSLRSAKPKYHKSRSPSPHRKLFPSCKCVLLLPLCNSILVLQTILVLADIRLQVMHQRWKLRKHQCTFHPINILLFPHSCPDLAKTKNISTMGIVFTQRSWEIIPKSKGVLRLSRGQKT